MNLRKITIITMLLIGFSTFGNGCTEEVVEPPKPVAKKPKPKPKAKTIEVLMNKLSIDPRVKVDEKEAPKDEPSRIAILEFFNAMLNVDTVSLKKVLPEEMDQLALDEMVKNGLASQMDDVSNVDIQIGSSPDGRQCLMGVYEIGMDYQVQVWYLTKSGGAFTFTAAQTQPNLANILRGDWLTNFFELQEEMIEIANQPDDDSSYTIYGDSTSGSSESTGSGRPRPGPGPNPNPGAPTPPVGPLD
jgi:hypothetical protein